MAGPEDSVERHRCTLIDLLAGGGVLTQDGAGLGVGVRGFADIPDTQPGILERLLRVGLRLARDVGHR